MKNILPIGTVVLLKNSTKKVMITGFFQRTKDDQDKLWDYAGCFFPEGFISGDKIFLFDHEQIDKIFMVGYQDEEQFAFHNRLNEIIKENN